MNSFVSGELAPSLLGRQDLARYHTGCMTARNFFVSYRGPLYSRAGTLFCGYSKQTGRAFPPRLIPFQFSIIQGLALEFGHQYMRVLFDGAFVTENPVAITGATQASPCVLSVTGNGVTAATANNGAVTSSYQGGDIVTLAGGTGSPAALNVLSSLLLSTSLNSPGASSGSVYAPGDTINLAGGTQTSQAVVTVNSTQVTGATIASAGTGGTNGSQIVTGTTGTGTKFQASVVISGGAIASVQAITVGGAYTVNPTTPTAEPVTGAGLSNAKLNLSIGVLAFAVSSAGAFLVNPSGGVFTQASTSGSGAGATFNNSLFGINALSVNQPGDYTVAPMSPAAQASTTGSGLGATYNLTTGAVPAFANGDWIYVQGVAGMTQLNGNTYVVGGATTNSVELFDVFGNPVDSTAFTAYSAGGTASRIFTLATPWQEQDLKWMKFTESADVMSICCVNQDTKVEYAPVDLSRLADTIWTLTPVIPAPTVGPPSGVTGAASGSGSTFYSVVATAISPTDGTESVASNIASVSSAVNVAATAGTITWTIANPVAGVSTYYWYKAEPNFANVPPVGATFGFMGQSLGLQFLDSNIVADYTQVPPTQRNPFARGQVTAVRSLTGGSGYTQATLLLNTATGSGASYQGVIVNGAVVAWVPINLGQNYGPNDTATVLGDGTGATVALTIGPQSGTYPSVPGYFQERRAYANSLNNPDTFWMSQPGSFTNFNTRNPTIASDAITSSPWATQVNGVQAMIQTSGGLLVMTGLQAWLLAGVGSFATNVQAISPSNQDAVPQAFSGCSAFVPPVKINNDVVYVSSKGSFYYDLPYQLYVLSEPIDLTEISTHLFTNFTVREHAWCEQPYKLLWSVRSDGAMLSMTYYKTQQVAGWARHDTNGLWQSCCSVVEPPVDALYLAAERFIGGATQCYTIERMDNRLWTNVEQVWAVDCALALPQPQPQATLTLTSATGLGSIGGASGLVGGQGYSAAATVAVRDTFKGIGSGATATPTIVGGVITAIVLGAAGSGYAQPEFVISDSAGSAGGTGASAKPVLLNTTTLKAPGAFSPNSVGSVVRAGGGIAVVTAFVNAGQVTANVLVPFPTVPNSGGTPVQFAAGQWTMTAPVASVAAPHLAGQTVTGLADGNVIPPTVADAHGNVALPQAASAVVVGLGFQAQMQSVYLDAGQPTVQGQRKSINAVTVRLEASRGVKVGANNPDGAALSPPALAPAWAEMQPFPDQGPNFPPAPYNAVATPLRTGDIRSVIENGIGTRGQVAVQQDLPLPCQVLALIPELLEGDTPSGAFAKKEGKK